MSFLTKVLANKCLVTVLALMGGILISLFILRDALAIYGYGESSYAPPPPSPPHVIGSGSFSTPNCYAYSYSQGYYYNYGQGYYYTYSQGSYGSISSFTGTGSSGSGQSINIQKGESATLAWSTTGFTSCTLVDSQGNTLVPPPGGAPSTNNSKVVTPVQTTTYTLTCNPSGASNQVTVTVLDEPVFKEISP